jgi:hypothetical protein
MARFQHLAHVWLVGCLASISAGAQDHRLPADPQFRELARQYREQTVKPALPDQAWRHKAQAEVEIRAKNFEAAVRAYGEALRIAPWWPEGYHNRAVIQGELGHFDAALWDMERFLLLEPQSPHARAARDRMQRWDYQSKAAVEETFAWNSISRSDDERQLTAFLEKYPNGRYASLARNRLKELREPQLSGTWVDPVGGLWRVHANGQSLQVYQYRGATERLTFTGSLADLQITGSYINFNACEGFPANTRCINQVPAQLGMSGEVTADRRMLLFSYQLSDMRTVSGDTVTVHESSRRPGSLVLNLMSRCRDASTAGSCYTTGIATPAQVPSKAPEVRTAIAASPAPLREPIFREHLIGTWLGEFTRDRLDYQVLSIRRADGTGTTHWRTYSSDGRMNQEALMEVNWAVDGENTRLTCRHFRVDGSSQACPLLPNGRILSVEKNQLEVESQGLRIKYKRVPETYRLQ